ncbi:putative MATE family efflux protein [Hydrogenispora ethanolica]|uniref:Putative MATE family efflux protein n=1 Tax=Hydrogenispora ethanolica TaxID=1082276 RepID=A0A4R1RC43_HYDET|nr:MATE family efflux transporter [Hydrogenispora ethanolica]TCL63336.1 putative MATE family efflux protein [Hydrogenispora ethanolica]
MILNGSSWKTILFLSIPTLMMGIVQSIIPVVDGLFINNIAGTVAASAIAYSGPIINMMGALAQGLSAAAMAIIGQTNGRGDFEEGKRVSAQIVILAFLLGIITAPILVLLAFPISWHINADISHGVFVYTALNALVIPFSFLESIYNAIKSAAGKPEAAFVRMLLMLVLKILSNTLFIAIFRWNIVGAVMASLLSNILICIWMYYELFMKDSHDRLEIKGFQFDFHIIRELFRIGIPSMLSSLILNLGFFLINNEVAKYGTIVMNGQAIANNITSVCFILPSSFGSSVTTMVSMNIGAGQSQKAKESCIVGCIISAITAAVLIAIVVPLSSHMTVLFTREREVLEVANKALHIYTYSVVGFGICMVQQGAFIGLGRTGIPLFASILRIWLLRYIFILLTEHVLGPYSVFWGNLFSNYAAALITTILILRTQWVTHIPPKAVRVEA